MISLGFLQNWNWPEDGKPTVFGWYHIMWLIIMIVACVLSVHFFAKKHDKKIDDKFVFINGAMLIAIEIFKQIFKGVANGHFDFDDIPFQFCSVPMYFAFVTPFIKNSKVKEAFFKFLASYGFLAGLAVMAYPDTVFNTEYIVMTIHTMIWHSSMVVMGVYLIVSKEYCKNFKELIPPFIVFMCVVSFAVIANLIAYGIWFKNPGENLHGDFNLFYISPYYENPIPVLGDIKEAVSFPLFFVCYLLAFFLGVALVWAIVLGIRKLIAHCKQRKTEKVA